MSSSGALYPKVFATDLTVTRVLPEITGGSSRAKPKSPSLPEKFASSKILALQSVNIVMCHPSMVYTANVFKSPWTKLAACSHTSPLLTPFNIFERCCQFNAFFYQIRISGVDQSGYIHLLYILDCVSKNGGSPSPYIHILVWGGSHRSPLDLPNFGACTYKI